MKIETVEKKVITLSWSDILPMCRYIDNNDGEYYFSKEFEDKVKTTARRVCEVFDDTNAPHIIELVINN